jgi:hypothetical protein
MWCLEGSWGLEGRGTSLGPAGGTSWRWGSAKTWIFGLDKPIEDYIIRMALRRRVFVQGPFRSIGTVPFRSERMHL